MSRLEELVVLHCKGKTQRIFRINNGVIAIRKYNPQIIDFLKYLSSLKLDSSYNIALAAIEFDNEISKGMYVCTTNGLIVCKVSIDSIIETINRDDTIELNINDKLAQYGIISKDNCKTLFGSEVELRVLPHEYRNIFGLLNKRKNQINNLFITKLADLLQRKLFKNEETQSRINKEIYKLLSDYLSLDYRNCLSPSEVNAC